MGRSERGRVVTIAASGTQSVEIKAAGMAFASIDTPSALTGSEFSIESKNKDSDSWRAITTSKGEAVTVTLNTDSSVRMPDAAFPRKYLRLVSDATEAAEREFTIYMHS